MLLDWVYVHRWLPVVDRACRGHKKRRAIYCTEGQTEDRRGVCEKNVLRTGMLVTDGWIDGWDACCCALFCLYCCTYGRLPQFNTWFESEVLYVR